MSTAKAMCWCWSRGEFVTRTEMGFGDTNHAKVREASVIDVYGNNIKAWHVSADRLATGP